MGARKLNDKLNILSANIKKYRLKCEFSQADLCRELALLGVTMYTADIYDIEYNKRTIKDYEVYAFAKVFNISLDDLYAGAEDEFNI